MTTSTTRRRMRSAKVAIGLTALVATSLTGCGSDNKEPEYAAICVDPQTNQRLDDDKCHDDHEYNGSGGGFFWFYSSTHGNNTLPPVGGRYNPSSGTYKVGNARVVRGGVPKSGGSMTSVKSGGFGGGKVSGG